MVKVSSGVIGNIVSQYNQKALAILQDEGLKFLNFFKCPGSILSSSWRKYHKLDKICLRKLRAVLVKTKPWWKSTKLYACRSFYTLVRDSIIRKIQAFDAQFLQIIFVISERTESFMWTLPNGSVECMIITRQLGWIGHETRLKADRSFR